MRNDSADSNAYNLFPEGELEKWGENLPALVEINVPDKGLIYREGDRSTKVFCIINGVVKLSVMTAQGNELTTALLRRGEIRDLKLGEERLMTVIVGGKQDATNPEGPSPFTLLKKNRSRITRYTETSSSPINLLLP